jgi:sortase A
MALYYYLKEEPSLKKTAVNYLSYLFLFAGLFLIFWSFYPVISFELYSRLFLKKNSIEPVSASLSEVSSLKENGDVLGKFNFFSNNLRDFLQVNQWFPGMEASFSYFKPKIKEYYLSIPKLNIKEAKVVVNGEDLKKTLVHFQAQSLPGEYGNVVIFGHSTLPALYNPSDYSTIFTYLPSLERGDKIIIKVDQAVYEYEVYEMFVVNPDEISVVKQMKDGVYLTLITCVPPGTFWKRLVVRAKMTQMK